MSSRVRHPGAVALAFVLSVYPAPSRAQQPSEEELVRQVDALLPIYVEAREASALARERRTAERARNATLVTPLDSTLVGPIRILTHAGDGALAAELFGEVWRETFPGVGSSPALAANPFVFQWRASPRPMYAAWTGDQRPVRIDLSRIWAPTREHAKQDIREVIARTLAQDLPDGSATRSWLTLNGYPASDDAYRMLALAPSHAAGACLAGETAACRAALGLGFAGAGGRLAGWFTLAERQEMVARAAVSRGLDRDDPDHRACVEENDPGACDRALVAMGWAPWVPAPDRLKAHLLWHAVSTGDEGAWQRLVAAAESPPAQALEAASGLALDEVLAEWRDELARNPPSAQAGLASTQLGVLLWTLVFLALAMRSTRWRLG